MSFLATIKVLSQIILGLSPIIGDVSGLIGKWKKKKNDAHQEIPARIELLEKNMELQSDLNEQFAAEMKAVNPALEAIQKSLRIVFYLALFACLLSLAALVLVLYK